MLVFPHHALIARPPFFLQFVRQKPLMVNIMHDVSRADTQPVAHSRIVLCMFLSFFDKDNFKSADETWPAAMLRAEAAGLCDSRTEPFHLNVEGMLR